MIRPKKDTQLHFVGIGGIGMSGIAEVMLSQGYCVSGSDLVESDSTRKLKGHGARIFVGHAAENTRGATVVVISSAVRSDNPEVLEAKRQRIPVIPRAEMLAEIMRGRTGIAVAGTHGKTTTTSMLGMVLVAAGMDPTLVIGGKVDSIGGNAKVGQGEFVVAEADESDGSFLHLPATYAAITNIDSDHLDHFKTIEAIEEAFVHLVAKLPFYGLAVVCGDDPGVARCFGRFTKPVVSYGFTDRNDFFATDLIRTETGTRFSVHERPGNRLGELELRIPGKHNVLNALATVILAREVGVPFDRIREGLAGFRGVRRRFDVRFRDDAAKQMIVDDYGHHPTEIRATLATARSIWPGRIITVFQPHRYTRTLHCQGDFIGAFEATDLLILSDIYPAGETPIPGVSSEALAKQIQAVSSKRVIYAGNLESAKSRVLSEFQPGDLVICLGAGSITKLADELATARSTS